MEFSRVLDERDSYINSDFSEIPLDTTLDIELVRSIVENSFPERNKDDFELYDELLNNLFYLDVTSVGQFREILNKHKDKALEEDAIRVKEFLSQDDVPDWADMSRVARGVFYTFCGLSREALRKEFGEARVNKALIASSSKPRRRIGVGDGDAP